MSDNEPTVSQVGTLRAIARRFGVSHSALRMAFLRVDGGVKPILLGDCETQVYSIDACREALDTKGPAGRKRKGETT